MAIQHKVSQQELLRYAVKLAFEFSGEAVRLKKSGKFKWAAKHSALRMSVMAFARRVKAFRGEWPPKEI